MFGEVMSTVAKLLVITLWIALTGVPSPVAYLGIGVAPPPRAGP